MMNLVSAYNAQFIIYVSISIIAYYFAITLNSIMQSLLAYKFGDDTAIEYGYFTFSPLVHIDFLKVIFLIFFGVPIPEFIPINLYNIKNFFRNIKLLILYVSPFMFSIIFAILTLFFSIKIFGKSIILQALAQVFRLKMPINLIGTNLPSISSFKLIILTLLSTFVFYNIFIATYSLIVNSFRYFLAIRNKNLFKVGLIDYLIMFGPIFILYFSGNVILIFITNMIFNFAYKLTLIF